MRDQITTAATEPLWAALNVIDPDGADCTSANLILSEFPLVWDAMFGPDYHLDQDGEYLLVLDTDDPDQVSDLHEQVAAAIRALEAYRERNPISQ